MLFVMCSFGKNSVLYDILCNKALSDEDFMPTSAYNYMGSAKERIRLIYPDNPIWIGHEMDRNSSSSSSSSNEGDGSRRFGLKLTTSSSQQQNKRTTSATDLDDNGQSVFTCSI